MTISTLVLALFLAPGPDPARGPTLLDFHADWCGPCRQMRPIVEGLERRDYPVRSIDVDQQPELAKRFDVENLPTFIVIDATGKVVDRREGAVPAAELTRWVDRALRSAEDPSPPASAEPTPVDRESTRRSTDSPSSVNPRPWETVVRITVHDRGQLGFGSGTIVRSTPEETIVLTCAHIFQIDNGRRKSPPPAEFPLPITVELFDGQLGGPGNQTVRPLGKPMRAEVIDYDFDHDVGLVRFKPGRVVPAARVVPPYWKPKKNMLMYTVGCSKGQDATAWNTLITEPLFRGLQEKPTYEAIQCEHSPKQGRSGGGLFTEDGYVAGVCNFAFHPRLALGLYATPRSIYRILDRNELQVCYQPARSADDTLVADRASPGQASPHVRLSDPGGTGPSSAGRMLAVEPITVPPPEIWGVDAPDGTDASSSSRKLAAVSERGPSSSGQRWKKGAASNPDRLSDLSHAPDPLDSNIAPAEGSGRSPARNPSSSLLPLGPDDRFEKPAGGRENTLRWKPLVIMPGR